MPRDSLSAGARIAVRRTAAPKVRRRGRLRSLGRPVSLRVRGGRVIGDVRLTLPYRRRVKQNGMPLNLTVQIGFYNKPARRWQTIPAKVDPVRRKVTGVISAAIWNEANLIVDGRGARSSNGGGSSWWNPFSWDWGNIAMRMSQRMGELRGGRTGPAPCTSGVAVPGWVAQTITNNGAELQLRTCAEGQDDSR